MYLSLMHLNFLMNKQTLSESKTADLDPDEKSELLENLKKVTSELDIDQNSSSCKLNYTWIMDGSFLVYLFDQFYWTYADHKLHSELSEELSVKLVTAKDLVVINKMKTSHSNEYAEAVEILNFRMSNLADTDLMFITKIKPGKDGKNSEKTSRGSKYRGVSRNGNNWQIFIVINKSKWYAGWVESELKAAALYDKLAILFHGDKVSIAKYRHNLTHAGLVIG